MKVRAKKRGLYRMAQLGILAERARAAAERAMRSIDDLLAGFDPVKHGGEAMAGHLLGKEKLNKNGP